MALNAEALNSSEFTRSASRVILPDGFDYALQAVSRLTNQFYNSTRLQAMLLQAVDPYNVLEASANDLQTKRWVDTAEGVQLDGVGYIVGESRLGRDDDAYRAAIKFKIFVNTSNATPEDLLTGLRFLTKPDDMQYIESWPATVMLYTSGPTVPKNIRDIIQGLSPAAIADVPIMVSFAGVKPFRFGREAELGEMFVNTDRDYLTAEGFDLQVTVPNNAHGVSTFGGLVPANFSAGTDAGMELSLDGFDGDCFLAICSPETDRVLESGHHLTGVY